MKKIYIILCLLISSIATIHSLQKRKLLRRKLIMPVTAFMTKEQLFIARVMPILLCYPIMRDFNTKYPKAFACYLQNFSHYISQYHENCTLAVRLAEWKLRSACEGNSAEQLSGANVEVALKRLHDIIDANEQVILFDAEKIFDKDAGCVRTFLRNNDATARLKFMTYLIALLTCMMYVLIPQPLVHMQR